MDTLYITWEDKFLTQVDSIDKQHRLLVEQLNLTYTFYEGKEINTALDALERFVITIRNHFAAEEVLMLQKGYPSSPEHKQLHNKLLHQLEKLYEFIREDKAVLNLEVFDFLKSWLLDHIVNSDRELGKFLNLK